MSEVDQVSYYCDGLKRATQAYVKLQNTMTLSEAMNQAVKYEMSHFGSDDKVNREKPEREPRFRGPPRPTSGSKKKLFTNRSYKPGHYSPTAQSKEGPGPDVARASREDLTVNETRLNLLCEDPLVYNRAPLLSVEGEIIQSDNKFKTKFLLDCGATTVYVSRAFVKEYGLETRVYTERTIWVKLGDNKIGEAILALVTIEIRFKNVPKYQCVAVVFDIPEEFDCVLAMPYFVDVQPAIDWKRRCFKRDVQVRASPMKTSTPLGKETRLEDEIESVERPTEDGRKLSKRERKNAKAEAMYTLGVVDSDGVETKYITRKKLKKFLRLSGKGAPEHDFMVVLTNDTIKRIEQDLKRNDEPDNVEWCLSPEQKADIDKWQYDSTERADDAKGRCIRQYGWCLCMDLMSAYYQARMKLDHTKHTAFQVPSDLYEYLVLPMGVSNAPATMHRLTSSLFKGLTHTRSFYDDIYVFTKSKDIDEHLRALHDVLEIQKKHKLYVKLFKWVFCAEAIPCLGDFIGRNGVRIDPDKFQTIRDLPVPRTQEQLHSFHGLTGYVQRFCEQYAELTAPLFTLLKKKIRRNSKITLNTVQLKNFKELEQRLVDTPFQRNELSAPCHGNQATSDLIKSIIAGYAMDEVIREIRRAIKKRSEPSRPRGASEKQYKPSFEERNLIWYQGATDEKPRIVVPNVVKLKHRIIDEVHESTYGGRPGCSGAAVDRR
ncbi:unnamed protein product [Phytophthora fragariaefolia]|uniref:Unnamed protein product n=1 Tax=Phytophthora fragariaefolia TaxID=1490495 RepID=A0A9W6WVL7_9STRA|nr:unnamed protein product [Phytophthora fragariaefolia]